MEGGREGENEKKRGGKWVRKVRGKEKGRERGREACTCIQQQNRKGL